MYSLCCREGIYMKKILVILLVAFIGGGFLFAAPPNDLIVYGYISPDEPTYSFTVTQTLEEPGINLKEDLAVHNTGNGVKVGEWTLAAFNHLGEETYTIGYDFGPLVSAATSQSLDYVVLEFDGSLGSPLETTDTTTYEPAIGDTSKTRSVRVRLTEAATTTVTGTPAAADDFTSTITVSLSAS